VLTAFYLIHMINFVVVRCDCRVTEDLNCLSRTAADVKFHQTETKCQPVQPGSNSTIISGKCPWRTTDYTNGPPDHDTSRGAIITLRLLKVTQRGHHALMAWIKQVPIAVVHARRILNKVTYATRFPDSSTPVTSGGGSSFTIPRIKTLHHLQHECPTGTFWESKVKRKNPPCCDLLPHVGVKKGIPAAVPAKLSGRLLTVPWAYGLGH